jgi:hypothetical protein
LSAKSRRLVEAGRIPTHRNISFDNLRIEGRIEIEEAGGARSRSEL